MKKICRQDSLGWWTVSFTEPCDCCGQKGEYFMMVKMFWKDKGIVLCSNCRKKWLKDEILV